MKIVTIVGVRGAGKTAIVEALLRELTARGLAVGTVKVMFCPAFRMDKPGSNTDRHARAGAFPVTAQAEGETIVRYTRRLKPSEIYAHYTACDWVLCEGDYELPVPRLVAAHGEKDALERVNSLTLAVSGRIANERDSLGPLPVLHPERDIAALTELLLRQVPDVTELPALDAGLNGDDLAFSRAFCVQSCRGHAPKASGVHVTVDGVSLSLTPEQEQILRSWVK